MCRSVLALYVSCRRLCLMTSTSVPSLRDNQRSKLLPNDVAGSQRPFGRTFRPTDLGSAEL